MKEYKIISKANHLLKINKGSKSIYYKELQKTLKEFNSIKNKDVTTINLYLEKISNLCESLDENKQVNITMSIVIITIITLLLISVFSVLNYYKSQNKKEELLEIKTDITFNIEYKNLDVFSPIVYSDIDSYKGLKPLNITLNAISKNNESKNIIYKVYLVEKNNEYLKSEIIPRNIFRYKIFTKTEESELKRLNDAIINENRILLYTGNMNTSIKEEIKLYMWMERTENTNYLNDIYKYDIEVEGYELIEK